MEKNYIDLFELQTRLKEGIECVFPEKVWLRAEISAVKAKPGGHCYIELVQSGDSGLVARAQAVIWSSKYRFIGPFFESVTGMPLSEGMKILVKVSVNFSQLYGLSLIVDDIDPDYSLGEKERARRLALERLGREGLIDLQKELPLPVLPYDIAVISASDAAGFRDFERHLHENEYGFVFRTELFPALMQGAEAPASISAALGEVAASDRKFDIVVILRGGGSRTDLSCYDDYGLAAVIARFPLPVFTAIGHDQDCHVCDLVAMSYRKTPTAMADELISMYADEDARILSYANRLRLAFLGKIHLMESRMDVLETRIMAADPRNILKRGYLLALDSRGIPVKSTEGRYPGESLALMFGDGTLDCEVKDVRRNS